MSFKTVSRVVNQDEPVAPATARRVRTAIAALGYQRNEAARSLRTGVRSTTVGVVSTDFGSSVQSCMVRVLEAHARRENHGLLIASTGGDPTGESAAVAGLVERGVVGLIVLSPSQDHGHLVPYHERGLRVVLIGAARGVAADSVMIDDLGGARAAVEHLIQHGHERIAFVGAPAMEAGSSSLRAAGYRTALERAGLDLDPRIVFDGQGGEPQVAYYVRDLLRAPHRPTAFFAQDERASIWVLRALRHARAHRAFVGFGDFELADLLPVPATVVAYDPSELAHTAAELLFGRLAGDRRPPQRIVMPTHLVERGSGELRRSREG